MCSKTEKNMNFLKKIDKFQRKFTKINEKEERREKEKTEGKEKEVEKRSKNNIEKNDFNREEYEKNRKRQFKRMTQMNKNGQPIMKNKIEYLFKKIKEMKRK